MNIAKGVFTLIILAVVSILFFVLLEVMKPVQYGLEPVEWFQCEADSECVYLDSSLCPGDNPANYRAVNVAYMDDFLNLTYEDRKIAICQNNQFKPPSKPPRCIEHLCMKNF